MTLRQARRAAAIAVAATLMLRVPAAPTPAQTPGDAELIEQVRQALAALRVLADPPDCDQEADPARWVEADPPDTGAADPVISAHRGALALAPENTLDSYEYAFAYGVDLVEVDVQQTADGRFVALHDDTVDRTTDGTGNIRDLTYDEVRRLNAADYAPWKGTEFDPAQVASLEEVLELARHAGRGLELDIKGSVTEEGALARLVAEYGLIEESIFNSADPRILIEAPGARLIYNRGRFEPPFLIYEIGSVFRVFGSRLDEYSPEAVAAAHDACGIVMPHAYDAGPDQEVAQFLEARSIGADGVQTNQPDLIVAAAGQRVDSALVVTPAGGRRVGPAGRVCLVNAGNGLGFPGKSIRLDKAGRAVDLLTGRDGCVAVPDVRWRGAIASFAGDDVVNPSSVRLSARG